MKILLVNTTSLEVIQINGVTNLAFASGNVTVTHSGGSNTYSLTTYKLQILW